MEKSEIQEMPEGMSSEKVDALIMEGEEVDEVNQPEEVEEKTDLAKEALKEATEESSPAEESVETEEKPKAEEEAEQKPEVDPKDAVIGDFRRKNRDLELDKARLEGELKARAEIQAPVAEETKSPLEIAEAAYIEENGDLEGFSVSSTVLREELAFRDEKSASEAAVSSKKGSDSDLQRVSEELQEEEFSPEKVGEGLDLQSITNVGEKHLTEGDLVDIGNIANRKGLKTAMKVYYHKIVERTLASGGEDAKLLQAAINARKKGKSQKEPEKEKTDIDALITEGEENTGEAENETHSKRLTDFVFSTD